MRYGGGSIYVSSEIHANEIKANAVDILRLILDLAQSLPKSTDIYT
jgi:hypothetical protein